MHCNDPIIAAWLFAAHLSVPDGNGPEARRHAAKRRTERSTTVAAQRPFSARVRARKCFGAYREGEVPVLTEVSIVS